VAQTRSLTFIQRFQVPLRHRIPHLSGNSAAVDSFARSAHRGKDVLAGVLTNDVKAFAHENAAECVRVFDIPIQN
jgi:uncharacterized membrane protein